MNPRQVNRRRKPVSRVEATTPLRGGRGAKKPKAEKTKIPKRDRRLQPTWDPERGYARVLTRMLYECLEVEKRSLPLSFIKGRDASALLDFADELVGQTYPTAPEHRNAHQLAALIRKYPFGVGWKNLPDPERAARLAFVKAEKRCKRYNRYFKFQRLSNRERYPHEKFVMRNWIAYVLGSSPDLAMVYRNCGFGPGASIGVTGNSTSFADKLLAKRQTCTPGAFAYVAASLSPYHNYGMAEAITAEPGSDAQLPFDTLTRGSCMEDWLDPTWVNYNKITFVPKTAKTHRAIAVEPLWNTWIQKGLDQVMRLALKRVDIDLSRQELNQAFAYTGSRDWCGEDPYCTIDLSSASDTIATEVVRDLLPPEWFELLNATRSPSYVLPGEDTPIRYEKFASMGNGFCFPLETLIFASIAVASGAQPYQFMVYGDDIVVRRSVFDRMLELLGHFGFIPNLKKTFSTGPFRESCGKDYFGGVSVRPIYLDDKLDTLEHIIQAHNSLASIDAPEEILSYLRNAALPQRRYLRPYSGQKDTAFEVALDVFMSCPFARYNRRTWSWSWVELQPRAVGSVGTMGDARYNYALMLGALQGASSEVPFARRRETRTSAVRRNGS